MNTHQEQMHEIVGPEQMEALALEIVGWARKMEVERKAIISTAMGNQWGEMECAFGRFRYAWKQYDRGWRTANTRGYLLDEAWNSIWEKARELA